MVGSALLSVVLLLRSSLAASSAKYAPASLRFFACSSFFRLSHRYRDGRACVHCPAARASLPLNNTLFMQQICFLLTHVEGATRHIFRFQACSSVPWFQFCPSSYFSWIMKRTARNSREELTSWRLTAHSISVAHVVRVRQKTAKQGFSK